MLIRVGSLRLDPAGRKSGEASRRFGCPPASSPCSRRSCDAPGRYSVTTQLLDAAWDIGHDYRSNVIEVYVRYLREKIDRPFGVRSLETVRGRRLPAPRDGGI